MASGSPSPAAATLTCRPGPDRVTKPIRTCGTQEELMITMPAVLLDSRRTIVMADRPMPRPQPDQVLIEVDLCGVCGSDLHSPDLPVYRGGFVLGHEASGRISWVGAAVDRWETGQRVAVNPNGNVCGVCCDF